MLWQFSPVFLVRIQQGDPLGPMLFALANHPLVCQLSSILDIDISACYLNDSTLVVSPQGVCSTLHVLHNLCPARGLFIHTQHPFVVA